MAKKYIFDPVKEEKGGVKARRAIWTSESLELAIKGLTEGKKLRANPFYDGNTKLLKADLTFERTPEEIEEWKRCRNDIIYFVENYCQIMTPQGRQKVTLRDYQYDYLKHLMNNRLSIFLACRQCGKTVTSALFMLHFICFNIDKAALVTGNKFKTAKEILQKAKEIFLELPYFLKPGVNKWNEAEIALDNGCRLMAEATTINSGIGFTYHVVLCDEFAHVAPNVVDKFYDNLFPVITASKARFMITSTQNGRNRFYRLYTAAEQGENDYAAFKVDWYQVPEWNPDTQCWEKRDEAWRRRQVANYGSEEAFNSQFGTNFDIGANTLISQTRLRSVLAKKFVNKDIPGVSLSDCWYWHPDFDPMNLRKHFSVTTCDLAEGLEQDYTVFSIYILVRSAIGIDLRCIGYFRSNTVSRDDAARSLMDLQCKWYHPDRHLVSIEYNTYGEIFMKTMVGLCDSEERYKFWDINTIVRYYNESGTSFRRGIKITSGNKTTHCILFKESFERGTTINEAEQFIYELHNFCNDGTGHYKASFGHDDMVMTAVQLEYVKHTLQYTLLCEDFESHLISPGDDLTSTLWNPYDVEVEQTAWDNMNKNRLM